MINAAEGLADRMFGGKASSTSAISGRRLSYPLLRTTTAWIRVQGRAQAALLISNVELSGSTVLSLKGSIDQSQIEP
ncbi:hypothetical protein SAMN05428953_103363 [Mesorhizobium muleiense]|uniref:Uncharacterized protein n=1 Tax=Mesorhizobium muleiense TaxID=1004279 RepID=A0A1G8PR40_9HYPH|nr:hypothetical protein SAMN05428953_103363 [Mesorhizobium muleiense]